ncbi:MAG: DUF1697 domain-containing protein [Opitutaceae bacterium]
MSAPAVARPAMAGATRANLLKAAWACPLIRSPQLSRMPNYVALIRGVGPANPNMRNDKLGAVLEGMGCADVRPVLASGNLVFHSTSHSAANLEAKIEKAFNESLGLSSDVIVRTQAELAAIVTEDPFKGTEHGKKWYLIITFRKDRQPPIFSKLDRSKINGPQFMTELEQRYGKHITTRTWNTVLKIAAQMAERR